MKSDKRDNTRYAILPGEVIPHKRITHILQKSIKIKTGVNYEILCTFDWNVVTFSILSPIAL